MNVAVLTSSRADYGIYLPLLKKLKNDPFFNLKIIAFGTHLSRFHGYTVESILSDGFEIYESIESMVLGDTSEAVSTAMALTALKFSSFWNRERNEVDLIVCLGDRYEMFAAVSASIAYNIPIAHIHGGEETLGAIDNVFRHSLTMMSTYHFTSTEVYAERVKKMIGKDNNVYNVGALSLDNLQEIELYSLEEFKKNYSIDLSKPTILITFHPETVAAEKNQEYIDELVKALEQVNIQMIITLPNADTMGNLIRESLNKFISKTNYVFSIENFGTKGYFSCMKYCSFLLGNTSSGIIEAASFGKYVINLGDRQKGRACSNNVVHTQIESQKILSAIDSIMAKGSYKEDNIYFQSNSSDKIIFYLKKI